MRRLLWVALALTCAACSPSAPTDAVGAAGDSRTPVPFASPAPTGPYKTPRATLKALEHARAQATADRIAEANATFSQLIKEAPDEPLPFVVSLPTLAPARKLLALDPQWLVTLDYVFGFLVLNDAGAGPPIQSRTDIHLPDGTLLTTGTMTESLVRFLDSGINTSRGDQRHAYQDLKMHLLHDPDALTMVGWSCTCTPTEVTALLDKLGLQAQAIENPTDPMAMPMWPNTVNSE